VQTSGAVDIPAQEARGAGEVESRASERAICRCNLAVECQARCATRGECAKDVDIRNDGAEAGDSGSGMDFQRSVGVDTATGDGRVAENCDGAIAQIELVGTNRELGAVNCVVADVASHKIAVECEWYGVDDAGIDGALGGGTGVELDEGRVDNAPKVDWSTSEDASRGVDCGVHALNSARGRDDEGLAWRGIENCVGIDEEIAVAASSEAAAASWRATDYTII